MIAFLAWLLPAVLLAGCTADESQESEPKATEAHARVAAPDVRVVPAVRRTLTEGGATLASELDLLPRGTKSLLSVGSPLAHGEFLWNEEGVPSGALSVWIDLRRQIVLVFRGGHEIGTAVILYGSDDKKTPVGTFPILSKHPDYHSRTYDAPMPHAMFLTQDGVALHGSIMGDGRSTHGCVGLPPQFARQLFEAAKPGDRVEIVRSDPRQEQRLFARHG